MGINYVAGTNVLGKRGFPFPVFHLVVVLFHNKIIHMARNSLLLSLEYQAKLACAHETPIFPILNTGHVCLSLWEATL